MCGWEPVPWVYSCHEFALCLCHSTIAECGGLESILHNKVLPGITETVSWTWGMSSASSFSVPWGSSWRQPFSLLLSLTGLNKVASLNRKHKSSVGKSQYHNAKMKTSHKGFLTFFNFLSPFFSDFLWASYAWGSTLHKHSVHFP